VEPIQLYQKVKTKQTKHDIIESIVDMKANHSLTERNEHLCRLYWYSEFLKTEN